MPKKLDPEQITAAPVRSERNVQQATEESTDRMDELLNALLEADDGINGHVTPGAKPTFGGMNVTGFDPNVKIEHIQQAIEESTRKMDELREVLLEVDDGINDHVAPGSKPTIK
jgi:hypothetical protein